MHSMQFRYVAGHSHHNLLNPAIVFLWAVAILGFEKLPEELESGGNSWPVFDDC